MEQGLPVTWSSALGQCLPNIFLSYTSQMIKGWGLTLKNTYLIVPDVKVLLY